MHYTLMCLFHWNVQGKWQGTCIGAISEMIPAVEIAKEDMVELNRQLNKRKSQMNSETNEFLGFMGYVVI